MTNKSQDLFIAIIGNYIDFSESMPRYGRLLENALQTCKVPYESITPPKVLGKLWKNPYGVGKWLGYIDKYLLFPFILRSSLRRLQRKHPNLIVHIIDHSNAIYYRQTLKYPTVVTCHDCLAIQRALGHFGDTALKKTFIIQQKWILNWLKKVPYIACVSSETAARLAEVTERKQNDFEVIYSSMNRKLQQYERQNALDLLSTKIPENASKSRLVLHVGRNQWYKNREGVILLFSKMRESSKDPLFLVMAGAPPTTEMVSLAKELNLEDKIEFIVDCEDETIDQLYSAGDCFLFPSYREGFGWPILEAQSCGCPTITSDRPPMNEIGGDAVLYINPPEEGKNLKEWAAKEAEKCVALMQENETERQSRKQKAFEHCREFTLEAMGQNIKGFYEKILKHEDTKSH